MHMNEITELQRIFEHQVKAKEVEHYVVGLDNNPQSGACDVEPSTLLQEDRTPSRARKAHFAPTEQFTNHLSKSQCPSNLANSRSKPRVPEASRLFLDCINLDAACVFSLTSTGPSGYDHHCSGA